MLSDEMIQVILLQCEKQKKGNGKIFTVSLKNEFEADFKPLQFYKIF